jgi:hypothetical protein
VEEEMRGKREWRKGRERTGWVGIEHEELSMAELKFSKKKSDQMRRAKEEVYGRKRRTGEHKRKRFQR